MSQVSNTPTPIMLPKGTKPGTAAAYKAVFETTKASLKDNNLMKMVLTKAVAEYNAKNGNLTGLNPESLIKEIVAEANANNIGLVPPSQAQVEQLKKYFLLGGAKNGAVADQIGQLASKIQPTKISNEFSNLFNSGVEQLNKSKDGKAASVVLSNLADAFTKNGKLSSADLQKAVADTQALLGQQGYGSSRVKMQPGSESDTTFQVITKNLMKEGGVSEADAKQFTDSFAALNNSYPDKEVEEPRIKIGEKKVPKVKLLGDNFTGRVTDQSIQLQGMSRPLNANALNGDGTATGQPVIRAGGRVNVGKSSNGEIKLNEVTGGINVAAQLFKIGEAIPVTGQASAALSGGHNNATKKTTNTPMQRQYEQSQTTTFTPYQTPEGETPLFNANGSSSTYSISADGNETLLNTTPTTKGYSINTTQTPWTDTGNSGPDVQAGPSSTSSESVFGFGPALGASISAGLPINPKRDDQGRLMPWQSPADNNSVLGPYVTVGGNVFFDVLHGKGDADITKKLGVNVPLGGSSALRGEYDPDRKQGTIEFNTQF